jgi:hypothetical protein
MFGKQERAHDTADLHDAEDVWSEDWAKSVSNEMATAHQANSWIGRSEAVRLTGSPARNVYWLEIVAVVRQTWSNGRRTSRCRSAHDREGR